MHREFCLPYDRRDAPAPCTQAGHISTYHTCGGMMNILDLIVANETDASETLSPPGTGGNITDPARVRRGLRRQGGDDRRHGPVQRAVGRHGARKSARKSAACSRGSARDGGYILVASDHFFDVPAENLRVYARAAAECVY